MLRLCLGFALFGLLATAQAAEADEDFFEPRLDLLAARFVYPEIGSLSSCQFSAGALLARSPDPASIGIGLGSTFQLTSAAKPRRETGLATSFSWQRDYDGDRILLQRLLGIELKGGLAHITFRPRAVLVEGERFRITFRPQSATIEDGRFKIKLQPHSAYMLWGKSF